MDADIDCAHTLFVSWLLQCVQEEARIDTRDAAAPALAPPGWAAHPAGSYPQYTIPLGPPPAPSLCLRVLSMENHFVMLGWLSSSLATRRKLSFRCTNIPRSLTSSLPDFDAEVSARLPRSSFCARTTALLLLPLLRPHAPSPSLIGIPSPCLSYIAAFLDGASLIRFTMVSKSVCSTLEDDTSLWLDRLAADFPRVTLPCPAPFRTYTHQARTHWAARRAARDAWTRAVAQERVPPWGIDPYGDPFGVPFRDPLGFVPGGRFMPSPTDVDGPWSPGDPFGMVGGRGWRPFTLRDA